MSKTGIVLYPNTDCNSNDRIGSAFETRANCFKHIWYLKVSENVWTLLLKAKHLNFFRPKIFKKNCDSNFMEK